MGRGHTVMSGLVVLDERGEEHSGLERSEVVFKEIPEAEKQRYVDFGEWEGRSGGYAIQTLGSSLRKGWREASRTWWGCRWPSRSARPGVVRAVEAVL